MTTAHISMNSPPPEPRTNTTPCPSVRVHKALKLTLKKTMKSLWTVGGFLSHFPLYSRLTTLTASIEELITHGLHALRESLQQDKELTILNTSIGIVGPPSASETVFKAGGAFRILEGESIQVFLDMMTPKEAAAAAPEPDTDDDEPPQPPAAGGGDGDVEMSSA